MHATPHHFDRWDGSIASAKQLQLELAREVSLRDDFGRLRIVAGVDVGFEDGGTVTRAVVVLVDVLSLQLVAEVIARLPTNMPYVPGLLSFRELPAVLQALRELPQVPDLIFVDGQGIAHPRRLGIAAHLGVATGLPTIGVAKSILCGKHDEVGIERGDAAALVDRGEIIGTVLRSKRAVAPLIVSPGHRVSLETAPKRVMDFVTRYRLPEPTRLADRLASRRNGYTQASTQGTLL